MCSAQFVVRQFSSQALAKSLYFIFLRTDFNPRQFFGVFFADVDKISSLLILSIPVLNDTQSNLQ